MSRFNDPFSTRDRVYYTLPVPDRTHTAATIRTQLRDIGYKPAASLIRKGLVHLLHHHQLEHPRYDKCSDSELREFAIDRSIIPQSSKAGRVRLLSLLKADAEPTFANFSELPAELRVLVYNFYVDDLVQTPLNKLANPPLALANRLIRNEVLPLFYQRCTSAFTFFDSWPHRVYDPTCLSKRVLTSLSPIKVSNIRKLKFEYFEREFEHGHPPIPRGHLELEFSRDTRSYSNQPSKFPGTQFHSILQTVTNFESENTLQRLDMMELLEAAPEGDLGWKT